MFALTKTFRFGLSVLRILTAEGSVLEGETSTDPIFFLVTIPSP